MSVRALALGATVILLWTIVVLCLLRFVRQCRRWVGGQSQAEKYLYEMECEVEIWYDGVNEGRGFDFVKFAEACSATGERVTDPNQLKAAFRRAQESGRPYVIDIVLEQSTDCSMGASIANIREFE